MVVTVVSKRVSVAGDLDVVAGPLQLELRGAENVDFDAQRGNEI